MCAAALSSWSVGAQGLQVGNYEIISSTRVGRTTFEYVMRATVTNHSLPAQGVLARVSSSSSNTVVVSRTLLFGNVDAGQTAVSTNTFTIRHDRQVPFSPSVLQWSISVQSMRLDVTLDSPASGFLTNGTNAAVSGTIGPFVTSVDVNGVAATINGSNYTAIVPLIEGKNTLSAVAQNTYGGSGVASVQVSRDTLVPIVTIAAPAAGATVSSAQISVSGNINDIVSGTTVNGNQVQVTVNDVPATVINRSYVVPEILLTRGVNKITAVAVDQAGNIGRAEAQVTYQPAAEQKRLVVVGGNNQSGVIGTSAPEPLLTALLDAHGAAMTNQPVTFSVSLNDGLLLATPNSGRQLTVFTDDKGLASVLFQLGTRVGAGNNQVSVTSPGVAADVAFTASSRVGPPARISALLPETQVGETGRKLPAPWIAFVTDAGGNPVTNTPVVFKVMEGAGALVDGAGEVTKVTDSDGRASVIHTLGTEEGINNNVINAYIATETNSPITYRASALSAQQAADTRVVGLVLDNANQPMTNVFCGLTGTRLLTLTDEHGQFVISNAPVGSVRLFVDARDRGYPGTWEVLEFDLVTIAGRANSVDRPIYMLPLDEAGSAIAGGDQDVTLQMKGLPGATMTIQAHSVRNANGDPVTERVMFTQVNAERLPMPPPRGSQFILAWTVQPAGLRFNPPAKMCIPNNGLPAGQVVEMFSFDHDLVQFAAIGTGRVSPDGSTICSDPGFGVIKSGWGGSAPPPPPPCSGACNGPNPQNTDCIKYEVVPPTTPCGCPGYKPKYAKILTLDAKAAGAAVYTTCTNDPISFTATVTSENCNGETYQWDFGDGGTSTDQNPSHSYAAPGHFTAKVTVQCSGCATTAKSATVTVNVAGLTSFAIAGPPGPADQARLTIGVAEEISIDSTETATWTVSGGGTVAPASGPSTLFTAPDTAGAVTVTATYAGGGHCDITYTVLAPTGVTMTKVSEVAYPAGAQGAGMFTDVFFTPNNVSFYNLEILEIPGPASNVTGYFTNYTANQLRHTPSTTWFGIGLDNKLTQQDQAAFAVSLPPPWYPGGWDWIIPWNYRRVGSGGAGYLISNVTQSFRITSTNGTSSVSKAGASVTRTP